MRSNVLGARFSALAVVLCLATVAAAQTHQSSTKVKSGAPAVTSYEVKGVVEYVEGNTLVVKLEDGELRTFQVPESRVFTVDGKDLTVHDLTPGINLTATVTTTMTPVTVRTVTVKSGTVWHVMGNNVIITLPDGENRLFIVKDDTRFIVNGNPATVRDLKKGMVVSAEKVVEEPVTEISMDTTVVGQSPAPPVPPPADAAPAVAQTAPVEPPPAAAAPPPVVPEPAPPKAANRLPLICGLVLLVGILVVWVIRRRKS